MWLRSFAGLAGLAAWFVTAVATTAVLVWIGVVGILSAKSSFIAGWWVITLPLVPTCWGVAVLAAGSTVRSLLPSAPVREDSAAVSREQAPALWRMVDELAERCRCRPPFEIRLTRDANASVAERTALLGLLGGKRYLYVGAPLLVALDAEELRAVLCHELAHQAAGHARLGALAVRVSYAVEVALRESNAWAGSLRSWGFKASHYFATVPMNAFSAIFRDIMLPARREHEFGADAIAADIVGAEPMLRALRGHLAVNRAWHEFDLRLLEAGRSVKVLPDDEFAAFAAYLALPSCREGLASLRERELSPLRKDRESPHPSPAEREERLRVRLPAVAVAVGGGDRAREPLEGAGQLVRWFAGEWRAPSHAGGPRIVPVRRWLSSAGEFTTAGRAGTLLAAVSRVVREAPRTVVTLEGILRQCAESSGPLPREFRMLARRSMRRPTVDREEQESPLDASDQRQLVDAVVALLERSLVAGGLGVWRIGWGGTVTADCPDITREELHGLARAAIGHADRGGSGDSGGGAVVGSGGLGGLGGPAGPGGSGGLLDRLAALGLDLGAVPPPVKVLPARRSGRSPRRDRPVEADAAAFVAVVVLVCLIGGSAWWTFTT